LIAIAFSYSTPDDDAEGFLQLVDQEPSPDFVIRLDLGVTDVTANIPTEVTFTFGWGDTADPTSPPWVITATLDNFRPGTGEDEWIADIHGSVSRNGRTLATFEGDTTEVPVRVDTDGDGDVDDDDTCVNIDITFAGSDEPVNICEALGDRHLQPPSRRWSFQPFRSSISTSLVLPPAPRGPVAALCPPHLPCSPQPVVRLPRRRRGDAAGPRGRAVREHDIRLRRFLLP
jgi:hypothetical protein